MAAHTLLHRGHVLSISSEAAGGRTRARLALDERQIAETTSWVDPRFRFDELSGDLDLDALGLRGARITTSAWRTGRVTRCTLVLPAGGGLLPEKVPFEPPATARRAHARWAWQRDHPRLYAVRHVLLAVAEIAIGLLGIKLLIAGLLPSLNLSLPQIPLPDIPLPEIPWPSLSLPDIPWPQIHPPAWVVWLWEARTYITPVAIAVLVATVEARRRRRRQVARDTDDAPPWHAPSTPPSTPPGDSTSSTRR